MPVGLSGILPDDYLDDIPLDPPDDWNAGWRDRIEATRNRMHVATVDDEVVGYADVRLEGTKSFVDDGEAALKEIYVGPDDWGEGVGTALLEAAIDALPGGVAVIRLETLARNDLAAGFYEARGFERTGETTFEIAGSTFPTDVYSQTLD